MFQQPTKFTIIYSNAPYLTNLTENQKKICLKAEKPNSKFKKKILHSDHVQAQIYDYLTYPNVRISYKKFLREMGLLKKRIKFTTYIDDKTTPKFNLIFFRKERIYTKLKYSRVPQYDAVS